MAVALSLTAWPRSAAMRSALIAAGGLSSPRDSQWPLTAQWLSQSNATPTPSKVAPSTRRRAMRQAPQTINSSNGTGGSANAANRGFQDSMPSRTKKLFNGMALAGGERGLAKGGVGRADCAPRVDPDRQALALRD